MELVRTLRYRIRYNPPQRLVLNALKRVGITVLPYFVFARRLSATAANPPGDGTRLVELGMDDMVRIAALPMANSSEHAFRARLQDGHRCFALTVGGDLLAYNWMSPVSCRVNGEWLALGPDQAYAYDIYTLPDQRGRNLAPVLNAHFSRLLAASGVTNVVSVVDYYNRPSLRFAEKIGCRRQRLSLHIRLFGLLETSIPLKTYVPREANGTGAATA